MIPMTDEPGAVHVNASELAAYVDRNLPPPDRARIEAHLADCAECRADALAALRAVRRPAPAWRWAVPALAAAVVVLLVAPRAMRERVTRDTVRSRSGAAAVVLALPDSGAVLPLADLRFVWRATAPGATYRFSITTEDGVRVHDGSTGDTSVTVPETALRSGGRYLWMVDVLAADGTVLSSPARSFAIRP